MKKIENVFFRMKFEHVVLLHVTRWCFWLRFVILERVDCLHSFLCHIILQNMGMLLKLAGVRGKPAAEYLLDYEEYAVK
jgi:hypothetical protein